MTPGTKNAATPSCARASAAALRTDMNDSSAVDDRTTRTRVRGSISGGSGMDRWLTVGARG